VSRATPLHARKEWALLSSFVTHGHDQVHRRLVNELVQILGSVSSAFADVNA
jgi:hypothetical protein